MKVCPSKKPFRAQRASQRRRAEGASLQLPVQICLGFCLIALGFLPPPSLWHFQGPWRVTCWEANGPLPRALSPAGGGGAWRGGRPALVTSGSSGLMAVANSRGPQAKGWSRRNPPARLPHLQFRCPQEGPHRLADPGPDPAIKASLDSELRPGGDSEFISSNSNSGP